MAKVRAFWHDTRGATSLEYAMIGALLSIMIVGGATAIGRKLTGALTLAPVVNALS